MYYVDISQVATQHVTVKFPVFSIFLIDAKMEAVILISRIRMITILFKLHSLKIKYLYLSEVEWTDPLYI